MVKFVYVIHAVLGGPGSLFIIWMHGFWLHTGVCFCGGGELLSYIPTYFLVEENHDVGQLCMDCHCDHHALYFIDPQATYYFLVEKNHEVG